MILVTPFPEEHLPLMWAWLQEFRAQMVDDYSPHTYDEMLERNRGDLANGMKMYAMVRDGKPVGAVWGEALGDGQYMGHLVFERYTLSTAEKLEMARDAVRQMFADGARKICWQSFADNRAFTIFLRRLGAVIEGRFREATRRNGELVDIVILASFPERKAA